MEKLVAKMQKKNDLLTADDDDATEDAEAADVPKEDGGAKEPAHSESTTLWDVSRSYPC